MIDPVARVLLGALLCMATPPNAASLWVATPLSAASPAGPQADAIFARAKEVWRVRGEAPYVAFSLREQYRWRGRLHDNWWQGAYRDRDRDLALRRVIVATDEERRLRGTPIALNLRFHRGAAHADSLDTNPNADAFPVLDPLIEPNASFGLVRRESKAALVGTSVQLSDAPAKTPVPLSTPQPTATPAPAASPSALAEKPLRELVRVEAIARDYTIQLAGTERIRGGDTYHLTLVPLREPRLYRLRDLWIDTTNYGTVQLAVQGLFEGKPYDDARWIVSYVPFNGRAYVQQIRTDDSLRFGIDRTVIALQYDFVEYVFPATIPDMTFQHML